MASAPHVLRVALNQAADDQSSHVLVAVSSHHKDAFQTLDLELLATDDQKAYVMTRKLSTRPHNPRNLLIPTLHPPAPPPPSVRLLQPALSIWPRKSALTAVSLTLLMTSAT